MATTVTLATDQDAEKASAFMCNTPDNLLDPDVVQYPSLRTLKVEIAGEPVLFAPFHPVFCVESLAHKPNIRPRENAYALRKLQDALDELAKAYGIKEIYWMCKDKTLIDFVCPKDNPSKYGYEVVPFAVLRKKV